MCGRLEPAMVLALIAHADLGTVSDRFSWH